jgi:DNA-binding MarR family transcriptional regulator
MPKNRLRVTPESSENPPNRPMEEPPVTMTELNRLIHEPARLAILTVLAACESADFVFLRTATGLTAGNLSVQIARLEEATLVTVTRSIARKKTLTTVSLTASGHSDLNAYWRVMERFRMQMQRSQQIAHDVDNSQEPLISRRLRPQTA